ncbi:MAG: response regulator [Myxococcaceae bacterium]|nr:response regulator [Myxococcaceae bacterium]
MKSDTAETLDPVAVRVLLVAEEAAGRDELSSALVSAGFEVRSQRDGAELEKTLTGWRPHLLVVGERLPGTTGREVAQRVHAQGAFFELPIVALVTEQSVPQAVHWLRAGASDVWLRRPTFDIAEAAKALLDELAETRVHTGALRARLLAWARRHHLSGRILFYPDTPFEGRARFKDGELVGARAGGNESDGALDELLSLDDAPLRWIDGDEPTGRTRVPGGSYRAKLLVVEDDDALRGMLLKQLSSFAHVEGAADGIDGLLKATSKPWDVVIADLNLPGLDGWGLLRQLRQHVTAREAAILVLSAHDELRDTLKAARAGARAYLKKTGRAKPLIDTLELLLSPRKEAWDSLARKEKTPIDLRLVGPLWTLRAIAELDLVGTLTIDEPLGRYEVQVSHGQLVTASAQTGSLRIEGPLAIESFLSSSGEGLFEPGEVARGQGTLPWVFEAADGAGKAVESWMSARMRDAVSQPDRLHLHPELSQLFARIASDKELRVLAAIRQHPRSVADLAESIGLPYEEVELALSELLRRGVLLSEPPPSESSTSGVHQAES